MNPITGQVIYVGPNIMHAGLMRGTIFRNGVFKAFDPLLEECPTLRELFVPIAEYAPIARELNFDIARNMRGHSGKHVTFYREVQKWLANRPQAINKTPTTTGVNITSHA